MIETWKSAPVAEVADAYEISSLGRLRRVTGGKGTRAGYILKPKSTGQYLGWALTANGYRKVHYAHHLVALAFIGPRPPGAEINHRNLDKHDNRLENLEYVTRGENQLHAISHGVRLKVSLEDRAKIRSLYHAGGRPSVLARRYGIHRCTVYAIAVRKGHYAHLLPSDLDKSVNRIGAEP